MATAILQGDDATILFAVDNDWLIRDYAGVHVLRFQYLAPRSDVPTVSDEHKDDLSGVVVFVLREKLNKEPSHKHAGLSGISAVYNKGTRMDLLGEVLLSLKIEANSVGIFNCGKPWGMAVPETTKANAYTFCAIDEPVWLMLEDQAPQCLKPGGVALVLHGKPFTFASSPDAESVPLEDYWTSKNLPRLTPGFHQSAPLQNLQLGNAPYDVRVLTMGLIIGGATDNHLLRALPDLILLADSASGLFPWLPSLLEFLAAEQTSTTPGYIATAAHLAELIFTSLIRAHAISSTEKKSSWLSGLRDPRISRALVAMHSHPEKPWTVQVLAQHAGMSRFSFGRLFVKSTNQTPIEYLIECRMQLAAEILLEKRISVTLIAERVGYQSERAFRELFKRHFGMSPRDYVKHHTRPV